ncbi:DUF3833 domain-containing protein [Rhodobacteraceae bacterium CCMM004]|nr:DUF3833 domain-containing protein [Rhodobacteraceae bacterium CCMM004]
MGELVFLLVGGGLIALVVWARGRFLGFAGQVPEDYEGIGPDFDLGRHLEGRLLCEGAIFGPTGRLTSRFTAEMEGVWDGASGVLAETFRYDSGATQNRAWHLSVGNDGRFTARASDVIGVAQGRAAGPAVQLRYRIRLPEDAGGHLLDAVDWMYLMPNGTVVNRSQFRKFGILVAELIATIRKEDPI